MKRPNVTTAQNAKSIQNVKSIQIVTDGYWQDGRLQSVDRSGRNGIAVSHQTGQTHRVTKSAYCGITIWIAE